MAQTFDLQGHRGCRALMPENTIPAFFKAVELGVTTLEMDVVISKDEQIVVSHEPWMSHVICSHPDGRPVKKSEAKKLNLYKMDYAEIQKYDCGMRLHPKFPDQKKVPAVKPALKAVVRSVERFAAENKYTQPRYNIEIKSEPGAYDKFQPIPTKFVEMVVTEIRRLGIEEMTSLQSFDINVLEELNKVPGRKFEISYLVERGKNLEKKLSKLSFKPEIFSPSYKLVSEEMVEECHKLGMRIVPWTVNDRGDFERLKGWSVDGVITDVIIW
jgi:glycerophosphoryl diester phosphodiesterase